MIFMYYLCNNNYIFVEEISCIFHSMSTASLVIPENSIILIFLCGGSFMPLLQIYVRLVEVNLLPF